MSACPANPRIVAMVLPPSVRLCGTFEIRFAPNRGDRFTAKLFWPLIALHVAGSAA